MSQPLGILRSSPATPLPTGGRFHVLHVHHASRADRLVAALADVLLDPPEDPFAPELVAVHSQGQERWVAQQLALQLGTSPDGTDGVCANLRFPFPGRLVTDTIARAAGHDPSGDPWRSDRLVWSLLEVLRDEDDPTVLGPLAVHLHDPDGSSADRRFAAVARVADLFDRYAVHRPAMVRAWAAGVDEDGLGEPLPTRAAWQATLWRRLRVFLDRPSPAERLLETIEALRAGTDLAGDPLDLQLPTRLSLFGLTSLPATFVAVLDALATARTLDAAAGRDVHLFLLHPSPGLWRTVAALPAAAGDTSAGGVATAPLPRRDQDPTARLPRHPLVATWGRDAREMQLVVQRASAARFDAVPAPSPTDPLTLLARLQHDIHEDRALPVPSTDHDRRPLLDPADASVRFHRGHGRTRQVEVLRDVLLHLLADVPGLEPRDIVVMCPDIETFAPLIEAVFGAHAAAADGPDLRVQLADRSLRRTNALLRVIAEVLDLADDRVTASAVLDLCGRGPVRMRFGFDEHELARLEMWLLDSGVRWGLDAEHRDAVGVPTDANTWQRGLDRLLVGVAVADEGLRTVGEVVPVDDVEGGDVELAGRLAELVSRLRSILRQLRVARPIAEWRGTLLAAADALCVTTGDDAWQRAQLGRLLDEVVDAATTDRGVSEVALSLHEVRTLLQDRLRGGASRASHRTGDLTVCTLVPMRSVPHRAIVLLGMDDEVFPRRTTTDGDDLLALTPLVGDRDPRTEDRQLLLDALLAARERLVVISSGRDARTNDHVPPAVPIGELLDVIDRTVRTGLVEDGAEVRATAQLITIHPLQPFDPRRFRPGALGIPEQPFGFDRLDLAAARIRSEEPGAPLPFLDTPLTPVDEDVLDLRDLVGFFRHPCRAVLRQRLQVGFGRDEQSLSDAMPVELEKGLDEWQVGDGLLRQLRAGADLDRAVAIERARGAIPPGELATDRLAEIRETLAFMTDEARSFGLELGSPTIGIPIDLSLPGGRRLVGAVEGVVEGGFAPAGVLATPAGERLDAVRLAVSYSRLKPDHRLVAWIDLLALIAHDPTRRWAAVTIGRARRRMTRNKREVPVSRSLLAPRGPSELRGPDGPSVVACALGPPDGDADARRDCALELLAELVRLRDLGLCEGLPLPCETAGVYADERWDRASGTSNRDAVIEAARTWDTGDWGGDRADRDPANVRILGELSFDELLRLAPHEGEDGEGWFTEDEPGRFGRLARRVWWPVRSSELVEERW
jgi:exodeoxyribonuclease V gamma subunit